MKTQRYNDEQAARAAYPDDRVVYFGGYQMARTLAKVCPWCASVFYAYWPVNVPLPSEEIAVDPEPIMGEPISTRQTCGHPHCVKAEDDHQFRRRRMMRGDLPATEARA